MALYYSDAADILRVAPPYLRTALLDDAGTGVEAVGVADLLLEEAEALVHRHASVLYEIPLSTLSAAELGIVRGFVLQGWIYLAHQRQLQGGVPEAVDRAWEREIEALARFAQGLQAKLATPAAAPNARVWVQSATPVFTFGTSSSRGSLDDL